MKYRVEYPISLPTMADFPSYDRYLKALAAYMLATEIPGIYIGDYDRVAIVTWQGETGYAYALYEHIPDEDENGVALEKPIAYTTDINVVYDFIQAECTR